ncbi:MAG: GNAT family N-acetyltransferase [Methanobacterium sp.]
MKDEDTKENVGYCISSILEDNTGEIDSIYLVENYRLSGIGDTLMKRALKWMDEKGVKSKKIRVAVGNDELISFYHKFDFLPRHIILKQK